MALTLRFTAPSSDDRDWLDYTIVEDGRRDVGRLYEDTRCGLPALSSPAPEPSPNRFEKRVGLRHAAVVRNRQCHRLAGGFAR